MPSPAVPGAATSQPGENAEKFSPGDGPTCANNPLFFIPDETQVWMSTAIRSRSPAALLDYDDRNLPTPHRRSAQTSRSGLRFSSSDARSVANCCEASLRDIDTKAWNLDADRTRSESSQRVGTNESSADCPASRFVRRWPLYKAIGPQLSCIFVDNGLLRKGEADEVRREFGSHFKTDLHVVDASEQFLGELAGVSDPQVKRKIIGRVFIDVFKQEAKSIEDAHFLAQGTLYPDVIESGANPDGPAATIKSHHNVGGLPEELGFELIEPLRDFFKDEVRKMGAALGLPDQLVWRHPFPGPGLSVRCLGEITEEKLAILREADAILIEELHRADLYRETSQAFAALLPIQSVGVMGDARTYEFPIVIRAVTTDDFMTADWYHMPYDVLQRISTRITNSVRGVNRVVYDCSSKPPSTIEWE